MGGVEVRQTVQSVEQLVKYLKGGTKRERCRTAARVRYVRVWARGRELGPGGNARVLDGHGGSRNMSGVERCRGRQKHEGLRASEVD